MNFNLHHSVIIIGGGPAGSVTANYLARYGFDTCLIEKKKFPREVLCGEFLSVEISKMLDELSLTDEFLFLKPVEITKFRFVNEKGTEISSGFNFQAYALKRSIFDQFLLKSAVESGVQVYQPAEVKFIKRAGDKFIVELTDQDGKEIIIKTDYVIAAYGKQNVLDKKLGRNFANPDLKFNAIKFHIPNNYLSDFPEDEISVYTDEGIYCGLNRVSQQHTTLCLLTNRINGEQSPRQSLLTLIANNKKFAKLFSRDFERLIYELPIYGTGNLFLGRKTLIENGVFMVGDAAGVIAPFTGDGIGMAVQSAKLISSLLAEQKTSGYAREELERKYSLEWDKLFLNRMRVSLLLQKLIFNGMVNSISFSVVHFFPFVIPKLVRVTRGI